MKRTPLYQQHLLLNAKMVDFAGWEMPQDYGSQLQEHHAVRQHAGMFDVSHMGVLTVTGVDATSFLRYVLANDVSKLSEKGRALYSCMLNATGGIIDDLIVYRLGDHHYCIVLNAGRREEDMAWLHRQAAQFDVKLDLADDKAIIAVQGPAAQSIVADVLHTSAIKILKPFGTFSVALTDSESIQVAATGYTGEAGVELIIPAKCAADYWQRLLEAGVMPCGLGARDTLRLEAGYNLYGLDMTETTSTGISNLAWTVALQDATRKFIGRTAVEHEQKMGIDQELIGLVMDEKGVLRHHQAVYQEEVIIGEITSGGFSPTLGKAIALARIKLGSSPNLLVERRGKMMTVKKVKPQFVRFGQSIVEILI